MLNFYNLQMKQILLLFGVALIKSSVADSCRGITIGGRLQEVELLKNDVQSPYQLAIDRDTNTLFFSYTANKEETFKTVYVNLKDKTSGTVSGVSGGFSNAVDNQKQIVYIGGNDGIYKFDYATKAAVQLDITDKSIWQMFFKDGLYFTTYPDEEAYLYKDGVVKLVPELKKVKAMVVGVDKNNVLYFSQGGELKKVESGGIVDLGSYSVNAFNTDADGNLYFSTSEAIYKLVDGKVKKVTAIDDIYGFAIESDNTFIYAGETTVMKLKPTPTICAEDEKANEISYSIP